MRHIREIFRKFRTTLSALQWKQLAIVLFSIAVPFGIFISIAEEVLEREPLLFDVPLLELVRQGSSQWQDAVVVATTDLGYVWWVGGLSVLALVLLVWKRQYRGAVTLAVGVGGSALINLALKAIFQRDRPELWERLVTENSFSFPSGHAMASASLALTVIVLLWPTRWRWWAVSVGAAYMLWIGYTRLYLGVHYPSDVLAGWAVAAVWVFLFAAIIRRWRIASIIGPKHSRVQYTE